MGQRLLGGVAAAAGHGLRLAAVSGRGLQGLAGLGLVAFGTWLAYHPAGWIVCGAGLLIDRWDNMRNATKGGEP